MFVVEKALQKSAKKPFFEIQTTLRVIHRHYTIKDFWAHHDKTYLYVPCTFEQ
jgi:hypothetical protein